MTTDHTPCSSQRGADTTEHGATPVSDAECRTMFRLSVQSLTDEEIASRLDRHQAIVARHARGNCHHVQQQRTEAALTEDEITDHLIELADELQELPTQTAWDHWPGRICSSNTVCTKLGDWNGALTAAGFPAVPPNVPASVRIHLYQQTRAHHVDESTQRDRLQHPQPVVDQEQLPPCEQIRTTVIEEWEGRVLCRPGKGYQTRLHVAADDAPLCQRTTHPGTWTEKSLNIYPPGQRDWCQHCLARLFPDRAPNPSTQ